MHRSSSGSFQAVARQSCNCLETSAARDFYHLRRLRSVSQQLDRRDVTAVLVSAFVLSRLDCCNAVLTGLNPASSLASSQRVLIAVARVVVGLGPRDHVTPSLCELHWLPIAARIDYKLCLLVHKSIVGQVPDYITELLTPASSDPSRSSLRSSSSSYLIVRRARRKIGDRAFVVSAPASGTVCPPNLGLCDPRLLLSDVRDLFVFFRIRSVLNTTI